MTSIFSSFFNQASQIASRIERMKEAEIALISFASRFSHIHDANSHILEVFNTKIPYSSVPLEDGVECQVYKEGKIKDNNNNHDEEESFLIMHGIKVKSNVYNDTKSDSSISNTPLVLLHGYANGCSYFYRNLYGLSNFGFGGTVYSLDLLGWGLSSRPTFKTRKVDGHNEVAMTEQFFVESLEAWRKEHKLEKMTLGGHSFGGLISIAYTEKYPQYVDRLILLSPVGIPENDGEFEQRKKDMPYRLRFMIGIASSLWHAGVTPSSILRKMSESRGRHMVSRYIDGRLPAIESREEKDNLTEYLYLNAALPGSGEYCLNKLLDPFAFAKVAALYRIPKLDVKDVTFIYGQYDWMDAGGGIDAKNICNQMRQDGKKNVPNVTVLGVKDAGHLLMLENWEEFNSAVIHAAGYAHNLPQHFPKPYSHEESHGSDYFFRRQRYQRKD